MEPPPGVPSGSQRTVLIAHPSADTYGADLQMLESAAALVERGWRVVVAVPAPGLLQARLHGCGAETVVVRFPVLRRADLSPHGAATLGGSLPAALVRMRRLLRRVAPDVVYVNTITVPWWLLVAHRCGVPAVCHVHEAEQADRPAIRRALARPLFLADRVIVNSSATDDVICGAAPGLRSRRVVVPNGVRGPLETPWSRSADRPFRLVVVGRLSPRKAPDDALEALAIVCRSGRDAELELCGTPGPGHEDFAAALMARADRPDLRGKVRFTGYVSPVWPALEGADVLVAPSLGESFGNAVVEAQLARRPVVATAVQGHLETVRDGVCGLLVPCRDPHAIAARVIDLIDDPALADELAYNGLRHAEAHFGLARYGDDIARVLDEMAPGTSRRSRSDRHETRSGRQLTQHPA